MNKIFLALASVLAATALAPEASAVPSFARQTSLTCADCHTQHFPVLSSFGRNFKATGYTMMGTQGKIEGKRLSLPEVLNASIVLKLRYQKDNTAGVADTSTAAAKLGNGQLQFPDEFSLFFGGRIAENTAFLLEGNLFASGPFVASFKMPFTSELGGFRLSAIPFTTDALGVGYGYELSSGGVSRANRWAEPRRETSAIQYNADLGIDGGAATGLTLVAQNNMGYINLTRWAATFLPGEANANRNSSALNSNYIRIAATPTLANWPMVVGVGKMSGSSFAGGAQTFDPVGKAIITGQVVDTQQTFFDLQAQGKIADKELGVYLQYAIAPATLNGNAYNSSVSATDGSIENKIGNPDRRATTVGIDCTVIPQVLSLGAAYRRAQNGDAAAVNGDNAVTLTAVYDLAQNVSLHLNHSQYSGTAHQAAGAQTRLTTFMLEAAW